MDSYTIHELENIAINPMVNIGYARSNAFQRALSHIKKTNETFYKELLLMEIEDMGLLNEL